MISKNHQQPRNDHPTRTTWSPNWPLRVRVPMNGTGRPDPGLLTCSRENWTRVDLRSDFNLKWLQMTQTDQNIWNQNEEFLSLLANSTLNLLFMLSFMIIIASLTLTRNLYLFGLQLCLVQITGMLNFHQSLFEKFTDDSSAMSHKLWLINDL